MLRILIVDDEEDVAATVQERLEEHFGDDCLCQRELSFAKAIGQVRSLRPHVVVLDIWDGVPHGMGSSHAGVKVLEQIWDQLFCPVVMYSASPQDGTMEHPFVCTVTKAKGDEEDTIPEVIQAIEKMRPHIDALRKSEDSIWDAFAVSMKVVAPNAFRQFPNGTHDKAKDIIVRAGRRRMAALMDEPQPPATALAPWEQYLCPPVIDELLLGDILRVAEENSGDPSGFRLVLTPSCDLVGALVNQRSKVHEVLVAKCCSLVEGLGKAGITLGRKEKDLSQEPLLSQGFANGIVLLPPLPEEIPHMAANLRTLEQIPVENLAEFRRVASMDSPFREMIAWAYMQIACRPGLPNRDVGSWSGQINEAVSSQQATTPHEP